MSEIKVDTVVPRTNPSTLTIGASGDTITIPSGATFTQSGTMNASAITAGTMATARLGSGTASSSTVLYGDQTYKAEPTGGKILQVLSNTQTSSVAVASVDTVTTILSQSITPAATSSKILIRCFGSYSATGDDNFTHLLLYKDGSLLTGAIGDATDTAYRSTQNASLRSGGGQSAVISRAFGFEYLDSPSTTSSTSYSLRADCVNQITFYIGQTGNTDAGDTRSSDITTLTLMEVGA